MQSTYMQASAVPVVDSPSLPIKSSVQFSHLAASSSVGGSLLKRLPGRSGKGKELAATVEAIRAPTRIWNFILAEMGVSITFLISKSRPAGEGYFALTSMVSIRSGLWIADCRSGNVILSVNFSYSGYWSKEGWWRVYIALDPHVFGPNKRNGQCFPLPLTTGQRPVCWEREGEKFADQHISPQILLGIAGQSETREQCAPGNPST